MLSACATRSRIPSSVRFISHSLIRTGCVPVTSRAPALTVPFHLLHTSRALFASADPSKKQNDSGSSKKRPTDEQPPQQRPTREMLLSAAIIAAIFLLPDNSSGHIHEITFQDFVVDWLAYDKAEMLTVDTSDRVFIVPKGQSDNKQARVYFTIGNVETFETKLKSIQDDMGINPRDYIRITYKQENVWVQEAIKMLPTLAIIGVIYYMFLQGRAGRGGGAGGISDIFEIGKVKVTGKATKTDITFKDVAGLYEAKEEVMEFVQFLKTPEKYERLGAKLPKGALLVGPPGTGKTLLAKAAAGEAHVPFFSISGSDFVEMFVGVGSSRVRDLFNKARQNAPCIVFIDEIDAVGKARAEGGFSGGNDERENTLNQLLVEMDGFSAKYSEPIVVLAATNRPDTLDKALLRPGRFDRQISIDKPDQNGRIEIFTVHLKPLKIDPTIDRNELLERLAALTPGFAGADIANVCNEAALIAARKHCNAVKMEHFEAAIERVIGGLEKKTKVISKAEKRIIAYHEAGHAVAGWFLQYCNPLLKVSIIPRGQAALGYAQLLPKEQFLYTTQQLFDQMCMTLGGRAAEEITFGHLSTGAMDDLQKVTKLAQAQVLEYGMNSKIGTLSFRKQESLTVEKPYSEQTHEFVDYEVRKLVTEAYSRVKTILIERKDLLERVAEHLIKHEVANHADIEKILGPRPFSDPKQKKILDIAYKERPQPVPEVVETTSP